MPRLRLGMIYFDEADSELRGLWIKQIPVAWKFQSKALLQFVLKNPIDKTLVDLAFAFDADNLSKFNKAFEKVNKQTSTQ